MVYVDWSVGLFIVMIVLWWVYGCFFFSLFLCPAIVSAKILRIN